MTNYLKLKSLLFSGLIMCSISIFLTSCKETPKEKDPEEVAEDMNKPKDDATRERDERFMVDAAEINMEEVRLGQLAQQKGTHADVKALGKMMEDAHTQGLADVTALAGKKSIAIPSSPTDNVQNSYNRLNEKAAGMDFDKAYCNMMVEAHKTAINKFESAVKECSDPDIVGWANGALPGLRTHLSHAEACEAKLKDMKIIVMKNLQFSANINAPKEKVWKALWNDETYRQWTSVFHEGSYAESGWNEGDEIRFLSPDGGGMYSVIDRMVPNEQMAFKHLGVLKDGINQPMDEETRQWSGAMENYSLESSGDDSTTLHVKMDVTEDFETYFREKFPEALAKVKEIAEG